MNPYEASAAQPAAKPPQLNEFGSLLQTIGTVCLVPAMLFAALMLVGMVAYGIGGDFSIPTRVRWPLAMSVSLVVFLACSTTPSSTAARMLMHLAGGLTIFSAIVYDAFNAAELAAYRGECGNPAMAGLAFRLACFSTYAGVPLIELAFLACSNAPRKL